MVRGTSWSAGHKRSTQSTLCPVTRLFHTSTDTNARFVEDMEKNKNEDSWGKVDVDEEEGVRAVRSNADELVTVVVGCQQVHLGESHQD